MSGISAGSSVWGTKLYVSVTALQYLSELRPAPSVGLQDVPGESVGEHLGIGRVHEQAPLDELDEQLARE